jgi:hypothetical protein
MVWDVPQEVKDAAQRQFDVLKMAGFKCAPDLFAEYRDGAEFDDSRIQIDWVDYHRVQERMQ